MEQIAQSTFGTIAIDDLVRLDERLHIEIQELIVRFNQSKDACYG